MYNSKLANMINQIGNKFRFLRKRQALSLKSLANETGIDTATLSRIECGKMVGTIESHVKISKALNINLPDLYEKALTDEYNCSMQNKKNWIVSERARGQNDLIELLVSSYTHKKMMPFRFRLSPKARTTIEEFPLGTERFIYVLVGSISIATQNNQNMLRRGEYQYINGSIPHRFINKAKTTSVFLSIISPVTP